MPIHLKVQNHLLQQDQYFKIHTVLTITVQYISKRILNLIQWHSINNEILNQITKPKNLKLQIILNHIIQSKGMCKNKILIQVIHIIGELRLNTIHKNLSYINIAKALFLQLENQIINWINYSINLIRISKKLNKKFIT